MILKFPFKYDQKIVTQIRLKNYIWIFIKLKQNYENIHLYEDIHLWNWFSLLTVFFKKSDLEYVNKYPFYQTFVSKCFDWGSYLQY